MDDIIDVFYGKNKIVLVSSANSYGNMKGGIDRDIIKKFPLCEKRVLEAINKCLHYDSSGRPFLPVDECKFVELDNNKNVLINAPTMKFPKNIQGTNNVYLAFKSIYEYVNVLNVDIIIACPCLGTGIGGMSGTESANQIFQYLT